MREQHWFERCCVVSAVLGLVVFTFVFQSTQSVADEALLLESTRSWTQYDQMRIKGTATRFVGNEIVEEVPFIANYGKTVNGGLVPYEIGHRIPNPGEPHLDDNEILTEAVAEIDGITVHFRRELITTKPVAERKSTVSLSPIGGGVMPFYWIRRAVLGGIDGGEPMYNHGIVERVPRRCELDVLGTRNYMGYETTHVRLTITEDKDVDRPPLILESLIVREPTFQVLKILSVEGGPSGSLDRDGNREMYMSRQVESVSVMGRWLLCDRVRIPTRDGSWLIEIDSAEDLPENYVGIWDFNAITGADFIGSSEQGTRKGSPRLAYSHTKEVSYIPYTDEEQERIRQFVISQTFPVNQTIAWDRVAFYALNVGALMVLVYIGYRKYRYG